jgi:hypothetical protein
VWIVAIDAIHLAFEHRMMLREMKLGAYFLMALEAAFGVFARIDDEFVLPVSPKRLLTPTLSSTSCRRGRRNGTPAAGHGDVLAARAVAGFAAALARHVGNFRVQPRMGASGENTGNIGMTIEAGLIADVSGTLNLQWNDYGSVGRTGIKQQYQRSCSDAQCRCGKVMQAIQLGIAHEWFIVGRAAIGVMIVQLADLFPKRQQPQKEVIFPGTNPVFKPLRLK